MHGITGRKNWNLFKICIKGKAFLMLILKHEKELTAGNRKQQGKMSGHKKEAHLATEHINFYTGHTTLTRGRESISSPGQLLQLGIARMPLKREQEHFSNTS